MTFAVCFQFCICRTIENVENLLKLTVDKLCDKFRNEARRLET